MSTYAAVGLLARMLYGVSETVPNVDPDSPDLAGDIEVSGDHAVTATVTLPTGDTYRVTVEWLPEESP